MLRADAEEDWGARLRHTEEAALERLGRVAVAVLHEAGEFLEGDVPAGVRVGGGERLRRRGVVGLDAETEEGNT